MRSVVPDAAVETDVIAIPPINSAIDRCAHTPRVLSPPVTSGRRGRILLVVACVLAAMIVLPLGARATANRWHDDTVWANSLRSLGGLQLPFDFAVYLRAADDVRAGDNPYVDPDQLTEESAAPYVYPPLLALVLVPATALPDEVRGSSPAAVLVSLLAIASIVGALLALDVRDWRCYPVALLYPPDGGERRVRRGRSDPRALRRPRLALSRTDRGGIARDRSCHRAQGLSLAARGLAGSDTSVEVVCRSRWRRRWAGARVVGCDRVPRSRGLSGARPPALGLRGGELLLGLCDLRRPRRSRGSCARTRGLARDRPPRAGLACRSRRRRER